MSQTGLMRYGNDPFDFFSKLPEITSMFGLLGQNVKDRNASFPRYNLVKASDDDYYFEFALAGYNKDDLKVSVQRSPSYGGSLLIVEGATADTQQKHDVLHQGIARRAFKRIFSLTAGYEVQDSSFADGLLTINVQRVPVNDANTRMIPID